MSEAFDYAITILIGGIVFDYLLTFYERIQRKCSLSRNQLSQKEMFLVLTQLGYL